MRVECYGNNGYEKYLTICRVYNVIEEDEYNYKIIDDCAMEAQYTKIYFKSLSEEIVKVKCVIMGHNPDNYKLTIGKIYDVTEASGVMYHVINDYNEKRVFPKEWFKTLSEIRNEKINKLLAWK